MIKLLLFGLLCGLGYQLIRTVGRPRRKPPQVADRGFDRSRAVDAQFEEVGDGHVGDEHADEAEP